MAAASAVTPADSASSPAESTSPAGASTPVRSPAATPIVDRPAPGVPVRNAARVPPRGLTIRAEAVSATTETAPRASAPQPVAPVAAPNPAELVARSPMSRPVPSPADSVSETLEFDVDAEFFDHDPDGSMEAAKRTEPPVAMSFEDSGETGVDLEIERLDRTVVSRTPPAPPVFDDEPTDGITESRPPLRAASGVAASIPEATSEGTVIARAPSAPAPWRPPVDEAARTLAPVPRTTVIPDAPDRPSPPAPFGGVAPVGSTLVPGTTPPPGGFVAEDEVATIAIDPPVPASVTEPSGVVDPSWSAERSSPSTPPPGATVAVPTVPAAAPAAATPAAAPTRGRGRGRRDARSAGVRIVMLGARGEAVAERTIDGASPLELGRAADDPWNDDPFIEPSHATLSFVDGGVVVEELVPTGAVFLRIQGRRPLREDDQVRVGQSLIIYQRNEGDPNAGPWGTIVVHVAPDGSTLQIPLGSAGLTVGRELGEVTLPGDTFVSSTHCRIVVDSRGLFIEDLESSNGTYLRLRSGERVEIGQCILVGQTQFVVRKR